MHKRVIKCRRDTFVSTVFISCALSVKNSLIVLGSEDILPLKCMSLFLYLLVNRIKTSCLQYIHNHF